MQEHPTVTEAVGMPTVLVFEMRPRWTPELKRQFVSEAVQIRGCGSWNDVRDRLVKSGNCLLVLDLAVGVAQTLHFLGHQIGNSPDRPVIVIGENRSAELEWLLRESGILQFFTEDLSGEELADFCRRQWRMTGRQTDG